VRRMITRSSTHGGWMFSVVGKIDDMFKKKQNPFMLLMVCPCYSSCDGELVYSRIYRFMSIRHSNKLRLPGSNIKSQVLKRSSSSSSFPCACSVGGWQSVLTLAS
jgi:hypothetical protein